MRRLASALAASCALLCAPSAAPATVPGGFQDSVVWSGFVEPTAIRFAPDGRVFVAEKRGLIKVFTSLTDPVPDTFADLRTNVFDYWDRGLLGLALDPAFPAQPYVYVLYTYDYDPNTPAIPAPRWGDVCPTPPGDTADGCVANGRLSRLQINGANQLVGSEQVLLENNWCQQFPSHSVGDLVFDTSGALLASAGEGASFDAVDYGQRGGSVGSPTPRNPCGDPPSGRGGIQTAPAAEGGSLRAQDLRTTSDPLSYDGSILRIDPATGAPRPDNPLIGGNAADDRTVAYGLRNPFRMTTRPGTNEVWIGDVGWNDWEEINRMPSASDLTIENFGWPCYEGSPRQAAFDNANLDLCESLYTAGPAAVRAPFYAYQHGGSVTPGGDACGNGSSAISGLAFYPPGSYPASYNNALFFADYGKGCIYVMLAGTNGDPDPSTRTVFDLDAAAPVDLRIGPGGDLYYVDLSGGTIHRIRYTVANTPPTAVIHASAVSGPLPLTIQFDGSGSFDPDAGAALTYSWDLNGDGTYGDSTLVNPARTYSVAGPVTVRLRVTDDRNVTGTASLFIYPGNSAPSAVVSTPSALTRWRVGDAIGFSGTGNDPETGGIPPSSMHWDIVLHHCPGGTPDCHEHVIRQIDGVAQGTFVAPDHEWYSYLEFRLRVTDPVGLSGQASVAIDPDTVLLSYDTVPSGLSLVVGSASFVTPASRPAIIGSLNTVSAPESQSQDDESYQWLSWSNGGARSQEILAGAVPASYVATYTREKALVIASHPGDDVSAAAGIVARAVGGGLRVKTVFTTNGDAAGGTTLGLARQAEAVTSSAGLGLVEDDLVFLGYPEGYLATIYETVAGPSGFVTPWGQSLTYGNRGLGHADYHTMRFGAPAAYTRANLVADLADFLASYLPTHIVAPSRFDRDFDHQATYLALIDALRIVNAANPSFAPTVHTTILRAEPPQKPPVWPDAASPATPFSEPPGLGLTDLLWTDRESIDVPPGMQATPLAANAKYLALQAHASQGGAAGFLGRFLHKDEFFWAESPLDPDRPPRVDAGADQALSGGALVTLQGSGSIDPDGAPLQYVWRQTGGSAVSLSDATAMDPTFTAPDFGKQVLAFELLVSDGRYRSLPDSVRVSVFPANDVAPLANAGSDRGVAEGALVQLDGSASSDPNGDPLTYQWTQTAGPAVTLSDATAAMPSFVAPAGLTQNVSLVFRLVTSDGHFTSAPDTVTVSVSWSPNVARQALATASSESSATGQLAGKAIDGVVNGYPGDYTKEWATNGQRAGAWIQLDWSRSYQVDHVILYDRPNTNDQVLGGTLLFADGSTVAVGALTNNGAGVTVNFTPRVTTRVRFTVNSVGAASENIGLAELEVYRRAGQVDADQDGWSVAEGDCSDADASAHPGAVEIPYDGRDNDCSPASADNDLDGDGVPFASDCNDVNVLVRARPLELTPLSAVRVGSAAHIGWPNVAGATGSETVYDLVTGGIGELRADRSFERASCLLPMTHATTYDDARPAPAPGFYYLVRARNSCGAGTFGVTRAALDASEPCP